MYIYIYIYILHYITLHYIIPPTVVGHQFALKARGTDALRVGVGP